MSMNQQPPHPINTLEDSLRAGHENIWRASNILDAIWSDMTGDDAGPVEGPFSTGILYSADALATKISMFADRLENMRYRIANPKVVAMELKCATGSVQAGMNNPSRY